MPDWINMFNSMLVTGTSNRSKKTGQCVISITCRVAAWALRTWFSWTPEVVGAATSVSGCPVLPRMVSGAGNASVVGGAVVLAGRSCITLIAGRGPTTPPAVGWIDDCWAASWTSSRCCRPSGTGVATLDDGNVTTGDTAGTNMLEQHNRYNDHKWLQTLAEPVRWVKPKAGR